MKFGRFFDPGGVTIWFYKTLRFTAVTNFCRLQWQRSPRTQSPDENIDKQGKVAKCMFFVGSGLCVFASDGREQRIQQD